jgi:MFS family permease
VVVFTFGEMVAMPVASAYISNLAPAHLRGRYLGVSGLNWALTLILAPSLGLKLLAWNPLALWFGCGALGVTGALVILTKVREGKTALAPADAVKPAAAD